MSGHTTPSGTPSRSKTIPRPPPIRPPSPSSTSSTLTAAAASPRRSLTPNGPGGPQATPVSRAQKGRARDLLRKHYGLGIGPPPPLQGPGVPMDPMNIGRTKVDPLYNPSKY